MIRMLRMARYTARNKGELLVLTGAVYAFVAYLTAFSLEVLFMIDLAKKGQHEQQLHLASTSATPGDDLSRNPLELARLGLESLQAHMTISCLAIAVLYFVVFVGSLIIIVALILRSTLLLFAWVCLMTTLYLPEFGLIIYVSLYGWGLDTRNGQTELIFYLIRAALNVLFIYRAHKLYKDWSYEKSLLIFKSYPGTRFAGYDSPYLVADSLTTTINPIFSSSTLNLHNHLHHQHEQEHDSSQLTDSFDLQRPNEQTDKQQSLSGRTSQLEIMDSKEPPSSHFNIPRARPNSTLSINRTSQLDQCELDLDYRTLGHQRLTSGASQTSFYQPQQVDRFARRPISTYYQQYPYQQQQYHHYQPQRVSQYNYQPCQSPYGEPTGLSVGYSTQSLDRRHLRGDSHELASQTTAEQVVLRPLGHQPFEYLSRPGSTSNLANILSLNQQPSLDTNGSNNYTSAKGMRAAKRYTDNGHSWLA